jgi:hypothetical protein
MSETEVGTTMLVVSVGILVVVASFLRLVLDTAVGSTGFWLGVASLGVTTLVLIGWEDARPLATLVLLSPMPYLLAGLARPPRPLATGLLLAPVQLVCFGVAIVVALGVGPTEGDPMVSRTLTALIACGLGVFALTTGPLWTALVAWIVGSSEPDHA